jgi:hypothetical protein
MPVTNQRIGAQHAAEVLESLGREAQGLCQGVEDIVKHPLCCVLVVTRGGEVRKRNGSKDSQDSAEQTTIITTPTIMIPPTIRTALLL